MYRNFYTRALEGSRKAIGNLYSEGGSHYLSCSGCGEDIGTFVGVEPGFWAAKCGEWTTNIAIYPCGLIVLALGWLAIERI